MTYTQPNITGGRFYVPTALVAARAYGMLVKRPVPMAGSELVSFVRGGQQVRYPDEPAGRIHTRGQPERENPWRR